MDSRAVLDADMATVLRWVRQGLAWWLEELAQLCSPRLLRALRREWPVVEWDGGEGLHVEDHAGLPRRAALHCTADIALVGRVSLPRMSRADLAAALQLEGGRLMPLPADSMLLAAAPDRSDDGVAVAGILRETIEPVLAMLARQGVELVEAVVEARGQRFDFLPAARAAGLVPAQASHAAGWWALVTTLFVFNAATVVWRDNAAVDRLRADVEARAPIAMAARKTSQRLQQGAAIVHAQALRRTRDNPLDALAEVTKALPDEGWVQRWAWDGQSVRLSGYRRGAGDMVKALRDSHRFADVRNVSSEVQAEIPVGKPFDLVIRLRRP